MKTTKTLICGAIALVALMALLAFTIRLDNTEKEQSKNYKITQTWNLPKSLDEISGIAWLSENKIACVQDEDGIIFIYDLKTKEISEEIEFAESGDYEAISINGNDAYVMRSDGLLYEVKDFKKKNKIISTYKTAFSAKNNIETLTLNFKKHTLLTAPKDRDIKNDDFKGLYEISLKNKKMNGAPIIKIDMNAPEFKEFRNKKAYKTFNPSDIAIHPKTADIYILEGKNPKLLILTSKGEFKSVQELIKLIFHNPKELRLTQMENFISQTKQRMALLLY